MKVLVSGATGNVGRHLVAQLLDAGHEVRALTRNPKTANLPAGADVVQGDLANPESFKAALEGVSGLHLITFDNNVGGASLENGEALVQMAREAGVERITVLMGGQTAPVDEAVKASDLIWTLVQPVEFMSNFREWEGPIRTEGIVREPFAHRKSAVVHEADIAAVAVAALTEEGHGGKTYPVTGGEVLTPPQMVQIVGDVLGREIQFVELTEEQAIDRWKEQGFSDEFIQFFLWAHGNTPEIGYTVAPTVEQVTGKPPRTFAQWVQEHAENFKQ